jgi:hypothetical protein
MTDPIITKEIVEALDLRLGDEDIARLNQQLNERVGTAVAETLDGDRLETLQTKIQADDAAALRQWLQDNIPDLDDIVRDQIDIFLGDLVSNDAA